MAYTLHSKLNPAVIFRANAYSLLELKPNTITVRSISFIASNGTRSQKNFTAFKVGLLNTNFNHKVLKQNISSSTIFTQNKKPTIILNQLPASEFIQPKSSTQNPASKKSAKAHNDPKLKPKNDSNKYNIKSSLMILKNMNKYVWPANDKSTKIRVVTALSLMVAGKCLNAYVPITFKNIIDSLGVSVDISALGDTMTSVSIAMLIAYGAARLGASIIQELRTAIFSKVQQDSIRKLSLDVYKHLLNMDMKFHMSRETGGLTRAVDRGTKGISFILSSIIVHLVPTLLEIGIVCGILGTQFGSNYVLITIGTMIAYISFTFSITRWRTKFRVNMNNADNNAASIAMDSLLNIESVKYFGAENYQLSKYDAALKNYHKAGMKTAYSLSALNAGQNMIFSISLTAMMYLAITGVLHGTMSIGDVVMVNGLIFQLSFPLNFLGSVYREMNQAIIDMSTLYNLKNAESSTSDTVDSKVIENIPMEIDFKNVDFSYLDNRKIFQNLSFSIPPGKRVAFVGPSGCGKSTILKLLYRFYNVNGGEISLGGLPINSIQLDSLRKTIAIVPQDTILFNATIFENICYGSSDSSLEDVIQVAKKANIHNLIASMPQGYDTPVGERGLMLSGGERQRIALARALLKKSSIIMFDEATSALDAHTQNNIMSSIDKILSETSCTAIFIAHRLRTIKNCDIIYVINEGKIVEIGTHSDLISKNQVYSHLWQIQENRPPPKDSL
ncbi:hypothetical protein BB561_003321 [Smittium simulii]|uniref:Iron-sulfur clusters transporter ATM1, mitochondrial n=1 Tax=Smittium simulii TaxID=133385 RepID=A0A2T9YLY7_9FUNG|nr:hypothetical protein BB561_003321 [Smittium simulii]